MQRQLAKRNAPPSPWPHRMMVGMALAACVALGTVLPRFLASPGDAPADHPGSTRIFDTTTAGDRNAPPKRDVPHHDQLLVPNE